ncbi:MAG: LPXTG cell wall anchor domain-containing protein [Acidimicrobiia bacterium]
MTPIESAPTTTPADLSGTVAAPGDTQPIDGGTTTFGPGTDITLPATGTPAKRTMLVAGIALGLGAAAISFARRKTPAAR